MLKSDHCFAVLDGKAEVVAGGKAGVYLRDTRHLSDNRRDLGPLAMMAEAEGADWAFRHWGLFDDRAQRLFVAREFRLFPEGFEDELLITNESDVVRELPLALGFDTFVDFDDYVFHITLAYLIDWLSQTTAKELASFSAEFGRGLQQAIGIIEVGQVEFCNFDTMHHFELVKTLD